MTGKTTERDKPSETQLSLFPRAHKNVRKTILPTVAITLSKEVHGLFFNLPNHSHKMVT